MTRKVAIGGSTTFPLNASTGTEVVEVMRAYGEDVVFLVRSVTGFDRFVGHVSIAIGRRCLVYPGQGGGDNMRRDAEMAEDCDELVAFINPDSLDNHRTGTAMLIECVLAAGKPVRLSTVADSRLVWASEDNSV